jgi:ribonuclease G
VILIDDGRAAAAARAGFPRLRITQCGADLFDAIEEQVAALAAPRVMLPSGGFLTIERTRALTAIDVDSGAFQAAGGRAETARRINREAAAEAGRQIRLRGLGGIIVIDFIQTDETPVLAEMLRDSLGEPAEIAPVPALSLVTLARRHKGVAPATVFDAAARAALRQVERSARAAPGRLLTVRAAPEVTALLAGAAVRAGLDRRGVGQVHYAAEPGRGGDFDVATG